MSRGAVKWKHLFRRVRAMDRAEIVDRLRQYTGARLDLIRYRAGVEFAPRLHGAGSAASPHFFFSGEAVPGLCSKLRELAPDVVEQIIERAQRICEHRFDLLGYRDLHYGTQIDWHCDRVHGKQAPRLPWFQVKYLDFAEVGDSKITWELNRHHHLVTLGKAYRLTSDQKFAVELFSQWHHWHAENPYPIGINWASSLEVAFRSLSWLWVYFLLADSAGMPTGFRRSWLRGLAIAGRHIDRYLSSYFSPNTHLLGEAVALFFIGTLCPEIAEAERWQQRGWKIVLQEADRQVRADGLHFEQSLYYHVYALDFFLHAGVLASLNQIAVPSRFDRTLECMLEALAKLGRSGIVPQVGDDDGGRLFDPARNRAVHLLDPLATGAVLFGRGDFKAIAGRPREETLWLLGEAGIKEFERIEAVSPKRQSVAFQSSGLYVMAGDSADYQLVVDAGPQGAHSAGHGHADALSLTALSGGSELLIDSGTFEYVGAGSERNRFRGTRSHNTLLVDGNDQARPKDPFTWERLPNVQAEGWIVGKTFDLFVGSHDGFSRLPNPVVHRRFVFSLKSGFCLIRDQALGYGEHQLDLFWHLAPKLQAGEGQNSVFRDGKRGLQFVTVEGSGWSRNVEEQPNSPVYGRKKNHRVLHFAAKAQLPAEFVTVLRIEAENPFVGHRLAKIAGSTSPLSPVAAYRYDTAEEEYCIFFGQGKPWSVEQWSSDAEFLLFRRGSALDAQILICCNATYVKYGECAVVTAKSAFLRCEIIGSGDRFEVVSSNPGAAVVNRESWETLATGDRQLAGKLTSEQRN